MYLRTFDNMKRTSAFFMLKPVNSIYGFIFFICFAIFAFVVWAIFAPMDDVVTSSILLRPSEPVSSVKCVTSGQLVVIEYENDQLVEKGDLLFSLDSSVYKTELEAYLKEKSKIQNDIYVNNVFLETIKTETLSETNIFSNAYVTASGYLTELNRYKAIIEDIRTKLEREEKKPESLKIPQNIQDYSNQLSQNELMFESWKNSQKTQALESEKQLQSLKNSIESHIKELERNITNSTIVAPITGRIAETKKINTDDYLLAGEEVLRIIPQNDKNLKADIYIDPSYIARIKVGNPVKIKFPGLPPSRYGMIETEIVIVPPDATFMNGGTVFIAEAEIRDPYLYTKKGQSAKLIPGIAAEGRIITDRSTVMQMVLRKLDFLN